jgi:hypothetical protein
VAAGQHALTISAAAVKDRDGIAVGAADFTSSFDIVLASIRWTNAAGGSWQVPGNWSGNRVPGPTDDVVIDVPGDVTITYGQGDSAIRSLHSANRFSIAGETLRVADFIQVDNQFELNNGTLVGGVVRRGSGAASVYVRESTSAMLDGVTLDADVLAEHQLTVTVRNGLTVNGTLSVRNRGGGHWVRSKPRHGVGVRRNPDGGRPRTDRLFGQRPLQCGRPADCGNNVDDRARPHAQGQ